MTRYLIAIVMIMTLVAPAAAMANRSLADGGEREPGWYFETELAGLWTSGNSESNTWGLGAILERVFPKALLKLEAGGTRTESTLKTRTAMGTGQEDFVLEETKVTEKTAELFFGRGRYGHLLSPKVYAFGGVGWLRNVFAGIDSRFLIGAGAGYRWANTEKVRFATDVAATYTFQEDVVVR